MCGVKLAMDNNPPVSGAEPERPRARFRARGRGLPPRREESADQERGMPKTFVFLLGMAAFVFAYCHEGQIQHFVNAKLQLAFRQLDKAGLPSTMREKAMERETEVNQASQSQ